MYIIRRVNDNTSVATGPWTAFWVWLIGGIIFVFVAALFLALCVVGYVGCLIYVLIRREHRPFYSAFGLLMKPLTREEHNNGN